VSSQAAAPPARVAALTTRARGWLDAFLGIRTAYVLGAFLVIQWIAVLLLAVTVRHNGWLYYAGGDQIWHYSGAYLLAHGELPPSFVGYGWSILLLPIAPFAGPSLVSALPAIVLFNTLVLLPVALLSIYGIAARIAGRLFGYWAVALWIAIPYLGILFVEPGYHQKYTELTLPQLLGLTSVPDFPSVVALLVAVYFTLRALDSRSWDAPVAAGLAAGYSIAIKPSNSIFLVAPLLTLLVFRWRALLPFVLALAPALLTLAVWKYRGLGELAAAPAEPLRLAGGEGLLDRIHNNDLNSWAHLEQVQDSLREHFWVARVMVWLPLAGLVALAIRSRRGLTLVGSWFAVYIVVKGTYLPASVEDASFWRILMPAFPAYVLLAASIVLLVPRLRARPDGGTVPLGGRRLTVAFAVALVVFAAAPLAVIAATPQLHDKGTKAVRYADSLVPVSGTVAPQAMVTSDAVGLSWRPQESGRTQMFYRVLRAPKAAGGDVACGGRQNASDDCQLYMDAVGTTAGASFVDRPGPGTWSYRIGVSANWLNDFGLGDVYFVSRPVTVTVP
jgi:Dolichyl-phosphate-mannose-protein mannosyltransferase